jgi:hypothetical protein
MGNYDGKFFVQNTDSIPTVSSKEADSRRKAFYGSKYVGRLVVLNTKNYSDVYEVIGSDFTTYELRSVNDPLNIIRCSYEDVEYLDNYVDWNTDNLRNESGEFTIEHPFYTKGVSYLLGKHYKNVTIDCTTPGHTVARYSGKLYEDKSPMTTLRAKIFNEGIKNNRKRRPIEKKATKKKGSMTDIATKLGIKIEESFLTEDTIITESKADQQKFIDKFGKEYFDIFWNSKQRLKNKGVNVDILWHVKNTSLSDMRKILDSISDEQRAKEIDIEGNKIPEPTGNYEIVFKNDEYIVYHPLDYISSIYCAKGGRWCTAGGYDIPDGKVKVSQAKRYFNQYINSGINLYYFIRNNGERYALAVYGNSSHYEVYDREDVRLGNIENIPNIDTVEISGLNIPSMIDNGSGICCDHCGVELNEDDFYSGPNGEFFCDDCYDEMCDFCYDCGNDFFLYDMIEGPNGHMYCLECFNERYFECAKCGNTQKIDIAKESDDGLVCPNCYENKFNESYNILFEGNKMRFILKEELLEDLKEDEITKTQIINHASETLTSDGFEEIDELNGVSFSKSYENEEEIIHCQFYIDTESEKYSSYVTSEEDGDKSTTFQQHGSIFDAESAVDEFYEFVRKIEN